MNPAPRLERFAEEVSAHSIVAWHVAATHWQRVNSTRVDGALSPITDLALTGASWGTRTAADS